MNLESSVMITECYFPKVTARDYPEGRANNANSLAAARDYPEGRANNANSLVAARDYPGGRANNMSSRVQARFCVNSRPPKKIPSRWRNSTQADTLRWWWRYQVYIWKIL